SCSAILLHCQAPPELSEDAVVVMDKKARNNIGTCRFTDLLLHSRKGRVCRDIDMNDLARIDLHDDEHVGDCEEGRVLGEEVTCPKLLGMITHEGSPCLIATGCSPDHVAADGTRRVVNAELGCEFLGDLVFAPPRLVAGDTLDEGDVLARNPWTTDLAGT
ncbi:hypothetical protein ACFL6M_06655, partial [Candidatus Eisenbacteria bacterium]